MLVGRRSAVMVMSSNSVGPAPAALAPVAGRLGAQTADEAMRTKSETEPIGRRRLPANITPTPLRTHGSAGDELRAPAGFVRHTRIVATASQY